MYIVCRVTCVIKNPYYKYLCNYIVILAYKIDINEVLCVIIPPTTNRK